MVTRSGSCPVGSPIAATPAARLPSAGGKEHAEAGGLMAYGVNFPAASGRGEQREPRSAGRAISRLRASAPPCRHASLRCTDWPLLAPSC